MATHDLDALLDAAAPAPAAPLDLAAVEVRARRRRRRRRAGTGAMTLLAAVAAAAAAGLVRQDRPRTVLAGPPASAEIPLNYSKQDSIVLGLLDGTTVLVNLPGPLSAAFAHVRYADLEFHGSIYAEQLHTGARPQAGPPRGWTIDVVTGDVGSAVGGDRLTPPGSSGASAAFVDRAGKRLGLQFGQWAAVLQGESMTDGDIALLLTGIDVAPDAGGFPRYRGSLPLWLADRPNLSVPGRDMGMSVFIRDCTVAAGTVEALDRGTVVCDSTRKVEVLLRSDAPLAVEFANSANLFVSVHAVGSSLSGLQAGLHP